MALMCPICGNLSYLKRLSGLFKQTEEPIRITVTGEVIGLFKKREVRQQVC